MVLAIEPATINFHQFNAAEGSKEPLYASLAGTQKSSSKIVSVESNNEFINVDIEPDGFDGNPTHQIRFNIKQGIKTSRFRERIVFKTDNPKVSSLNLYVRGEALGNIAVTPQHLALGLITPGSTVKKSIQLESTTDSATFNVTDVSSTVEGLTAELKTITPGKEYTVECSMVTDEPQPVIRGNIVITTDDVNQKTITVRVFGRIGKRPVPVPL